ncbi:uncharacterized protein LOC124887099 [Capsicum annuum]|uniref:uncharacterized protein LOC124887099 n=1 Tax=Capsicum annuum TaxID=4072 RepID=UPI001FB13698|nr:uncharacterized protein LOC124887099 [Capsicum annuum]
MVINVLINSPMGSVFLESHDASDSSIDATKLFKFFENTILKIGKENVVQVVTDNARGNKKAGELLKGVYPHIFWTPCAVHFFVKTVKIHSYISQRALLLNMMRRFTNQRNLVKLAKTSYCTSFGGWRETPPMGYIYEAMDRAKESIESTFDHDKRKYEKVFEIIDARWTDQLHQPLHATTHILTSGLYGKNSEMKTLDEEVWLGYHASLIDKIWEELGRYMKAGGLLGLESTIRAGTLRSPVDDANEWLTRALSNHEDEEVYEGEDLTYGHVASASGVEESVFGFRGSTLNDKERAGSSRTFVDEASDDEEDNVQDNSMMTLQEFGDIVEE